MDVGDVWLELEETLPRLFLSYRSRLSTLSVEKKPDDTLLSEADLEIQEYLISILKEAAPDAGVVAEEAGVNSPGAASEGRFWVIDPIDGTKQFVAPGQTEFCSVVALVEKLVPVAAFVLAPELGVGRQPLVIKLAEGEISVNGRRNAPFAGPTGLFSTTRESKSSARPWEMRLRERGYRLKTRTTSQTLDMVRTMVDLVPWTEERLESFDLFYRRDQKVWDGIAGLSLARASGRETLGHESSPLIPIPLDSLESEPPVFRSTAVGTRAALRVLTQAWRS